MAFCFVNLSIFATLWIMELPALDYQNSFVFMHETGNSFPGASPHEEHNVKTSAFYVHVQHEICMLPQPTN